MLDSDVSHSQSGSDVVFSDAPSMFQWPSHAYTDFVLYEQHTHDEGEFGVDADICWQDAHGSPFSAEISPCPANAGSWGSPHQEPGLDLDFALNDDECKRLSTHCNPERAVITLAEDGRQAQRNGRFHCQDCDKDYGRPEHLRRHREM